MRFAAETWLILMIGLPFLAALLRWSDRHARRRLSDLLGERAPEHVERENHRLRQWRRFLLLSGLFWLILALARPQWGANEVIVKERGTDIVIALDISNSMLAEDVPPNRLERAKSELVDFLSRLRRGRVGLVLFAGSAFVQCPLTMDFGTAQIFLRMAEPDMISAQGTAIGAALTTARNLLIGGSGSDRGNSFQAILLVTDGEDLEGEWEREVEQCQDRDIVILPVGVGRETGGLIPVTDTKGRSAGFMKDAEGNVVMTRLDLAALERMAAMSGGTTFQIGGDGLAGERLRDMLVRLGERDLEERRISAYKERFVWPLALAFLSFWIWLLVRPRRRYFSWRRFARVTGMVLCLAGPGLWLTPNTAKAASPLRPPGAAEVDRGREFFAADEFELALQTFETARAINPDDSRLSLAVGEALFQLERYQEAVQEFQRSLALADSDELKAESLYNAGTSWLAQGDPAKAAEAFLQSLRINPNQTDALHNLEVALKWLEQSQQNQQEDQEQDQQQEQQQDQQDQQQNQQQNQDQPQDRSQPDQQQEQPSDQQDESEQESDQDQEQDAQQNQQQEQPQSQSESETEPEPAPDTQQMDQDEMTPEEALNLLRALDHDEEQLKRSVEKRLRGGKPKSGKRW